ncbi:uncharacterized protein [Clytia hemisphaerica]|uniref:uncharacterized protein n=1 Tax=Clytia hemisphaerica TaxID=252671 RepID=UPI0034D3D31B|eukprot:TCONS_00027251-protein
MLLLKIWILSTLSLLGVESVCPSTTVPWDNGNCKPISDAVKEATQFLQNQMPDFDKPNNATLFDGGIVEPTVNISLMARQIYPWAGSVPLDVYFDYVLPYANVNEARTNWRQILWDKLSPLAAQYFEFRRKYIRSNIYEIMALFVNKQAWKELAPKGKESIVFKSSQTPLIYDPMSTMLFGYASCTGISILYIDAMRA